ncbi:tetratricopeptide repeat protein [Clostridium sp.]|uniref:tetratricopeptide repeat protein n=1 Tax=Clostridium sp. TaxID=1506 RepID=UPI00260A4793|nr:tetratricopeptide repeat protein [Clostridium sp.]
MLGILTDIAFGLSINLASNLAWDKKIQRDDMMSIEKIRLQMSEFNRKYDNTELDTNAFDSFMKSSDIMGKIYTRIFESYKIESEEMFEFKRKISKYAVDEVNKHYKQYSRCIKNEDIFFEYFCDLVDSLLKIRENLLTLSSSAQTGIITERIDIARHEIKEEIEITKQELTEEIKAQFAQMKEDNVFAEDRIKDIKTLVSLYKFSEANEEISEILEAQQFLSNSQKELIYYQRARIIINAGKYSKLEDILDKIGRINKNSKYITEINFYIACHKKDTILFEETVVNFKKYKYSLEQIEIKRANFEMQIDNLDKVLNIITTEGEIKLELQEFAEAHYYYGICLMKLEDFEKAYIEFSKAFELSENIIHKYNVLIAKYHILYNDIKLRISRPKEYLENVINTINEFKNIKYIIEFFSDEQATYYWMCLINLMLVVDPKEALDEIEIIDSKLNEYELIKTIKADVYFKNFMDNDAKNILEDIWDLIPINTIYLFTIYEKENNWNGILDKYEQLSQPEFSKNHAILMLVIKAKSETSGYETIRNEILKLSQIYDSKVMFIRDSIKLVLENKDEEALIKILNNINLKKNCMNDYELESIGRILNEYSRFEESRNLIEGSIEKSETLLNIYIETFEKSDKTPEVIRTVYKKIKLLYNKGYRYKALLRFKVNLEFIQGIYRKVIQTLEIYKDIYGMDDYYAYYYVASNIEKNEYDGLDKEVEILLNTDKTSLHQLVAVLKARQGVWDVAQRIALSALYHSHDNLGKEILFNYIGMYFSNIDKNKNSIELEDVVYNSVVTIKSKDKLRNIAIHIDKTIITKSGEIKFGCENYDSDSYISLILTTVGKKGESVIINDDEYEIVNIIDLFAYFHNFCLSKLESDYPKHDYFIKCSAPTPKEAIVEMTKVMELVTEDRYKHLNMYNFGVKCGLPISYLSGKNIERYSETIMSLLSHKDQHLYAGEVSVYKDTEYVISLSSIIMLAAFGILDKLEQISDKCVITNEVEKSIREGIKESQKHAKIDSGVASLSENGELSSYFYTEDDKKSRKVYWTNILQAISKIRHVEISIEDNEIYEVFAKYLLDEDISSVELSRKFNNVLVCDDLFIRSLHHGATGTTKTTNIIGLLISENLVTYEELINVVSKLTKSKYLYPLNASLIYQILLWITSIQENEKRNFYFDELKEIYKNILDNISFPYYRGIHEEFIMMGQRLKIPMALIYELVREPFKLKPFDEFVREKSHEILCSMSIINDTDISRSNTLDNKNK